jgi:poly(3-hydroxybutyrate) depolymerase
VDGAGGTAPVLTDGCEQNDRPATGQYTIDVDGTTRSYYLLAPISDGPMPLVVSFHGYGGTGQGSMGTFQPTETTGGNAVFVFPDGVAQSWYENAIGWDTRSNTSPDIKFVRALIDETKAKQCVDAARVYAIGFSWGGWMANQVGCALGPEIRGVVAVAGGGPDGGACTGAVSTLIAHGLNDQSELISSGQASRDKWLGLNGCDASSAGAAVDGCVAYDGCDKPVWWCEHAGGHEVPANLLPGYWDFLSSVP